MKADHQDVTHVDETTFPHHSEPIDNGDCHAESTYLAMDFTSSRMVDDLVDSEIANDNEEKSSKRNIPPDPANEVDETSYGLFGTSTASELAAREDVQNQPLYSPRPLLPSIYNSPFAPQPGETTPESRPGTAKRTLSGHSRQSSQTTVPMQPLISHAMGSSQSSMPEPTNPNLPMERAYWNQPHVDVSFPPKTNYTTGRKSSIGFGNDNYNGLDFISSAVEFGCSGSVQGATNLQTPPNGQGGG